VVDRVVRGGAGRRPGASRRAGGSSDTHSGEQVVVACQSTGTSPDHLLATEFRRDRAVTRWCRWGGAVRAHV